MSNNKKFIKTYVELFEVTRNPFDAMVYSFILTEGEYQKTSQPKIEQTHLQNVFHVGRRVITRTIKELKEDGLLDYVSDYNYAGGKAYTTTKFTLKYQLNESKEEATVSEQTTYEQEQEPQTETVDNHAEQTDTNTNDDIFNDGNKTKEEVQRERQNSPYAKYMTNTHYNNEKDDLPF